MRLSIFGYNIFPSLQIIRQRKRKRGKPNYALRHCDVCGIELKGGTKADHLLATHPEYKFHVTRPDGSCYYWCDICHRTVGGVAAIVKHFEACHAEILEQKR